MKVHIGSDAGFSLVETLVATFIFALISAASVALLTGYQDSRIGLAATDERLARLATARSILRGDFFAAINRPVRDQLGGSLPAFEGGHHLTGGTRFRLVRDGHAGAILRGDTSVVQRIDYLLDGSTLVRRSYDRTDLVPDTAYVDQQILSGVTNVSLRFASEGIWASEWGAGLTAEPLPRLAELTIIFEGERETRMVFLVGSNAG